MLENIDIIETLSNTTKKRVPLRRFLAKLTRNTCISNKFLLKIALKVITYNLMSRTILKNSLKNTPFSEV